MLNNPHMGSHWHCPAIHTPLTAPAAYSGGGQTTPTLSVSLQITSSHGFAHSLAQFSSLLPPHPSRITLIPIHGTESLLSGSLFHLPVTLCCWFALFQANIYTLPSLFSIVPLTVVFCISPITLDGSIYLQKRAQLINIFILSPLSKCLNNSVANILGWLLGINKLIVSPLQLAQKNIAPCCELVLSTTRVSHKGKLSIACLSAWQRCYSCSWMPTPFC